MRVVRLAARSEARDLVLVGVGAAVGFVAGVWLSGRARRGRAAPTGVESRRHLARGWNRLERAWEDTMEGLAGARDRRRSRRPVDLDALASRLARIPGGESVAVHSLGPGIVELVGSAPSDEDAANLLGAAEEHEGVDTVVNRIWTAGPSPAAPESVGGAAPIDHVQEAE